MSYTLQEVPTRALLTALDKCRPYEENSFRNEQVFVHRRPAAVPGGFEIVSATKDELRAELHKRPHIPNKAEAKLLRQLMAKTGWTEEQLRAHPKFGMQLVDIQFPNRQVMPRGSYLVEVKKRFGKHFGKRFKVR